MAKPKIIVEIDEFGETKLEVKGVSGQSCTALTEELEREIGEVKKRKLKTEYFQKAKSQTKTKLRL